MIQPIVYSNITEKNALEHEMFKALSPEESMIQALELLDFFAALRGKAEDMYDDAYGEVEWIELTFKK